MKFMKYSLVIFFIVLLSACGKNTPTFDEVQDELELIYALNETAVSVTSDLSFKELTFNEKYVTVEWVSSDEIHAKIIGQIIKITQDDSRDIEVTLTAHVTIKKETRSFDFAIIILKKPENPKQLYDVQIIDGEESKTISVESGTLLNLIDPIKEGYIFSGYYLNDSFTEIWESKPIETTLTLYVYWIEEVVIDLESPTITGTRDLYVTIGDTIDYLFGITVTDDIDQVPYLYVDDSEVNLLLPGEYELTYIAIDSSDNETTIVVKVIVEEAALLTLTETFELIQGSDSSYVDKSYTGVEGIVWTYKGMRSDQTLDGKALTFGQSSSNYIKAQLQGGMSGVSIDFAHVFSGSEKRRVDLYINDTLVHTFEVVSSTQTYTYKNVNIEGSFTFELRNTGGQRVIVDNIVIYRQNDSEDAKSIQMDIKNLFFPTHVMYPTTIQLQRTGQKGSVITYRFKDTNNPDNSYLNLETGQVTPPVDQLVSTVIVITFTKGSEQQSIERLVYLGEGEPLTITQASKEIGVVKTKAVLTGFVVDNQVIRAFFQDQTGAIEVRLTLDQLSNLETGSSYIIKGSVVKTPYLYLENVQSLEKKETSVFNPIEVNGTQLQQNLSKYVYVEGVLQKDYTSGDVSIITNQGLVLVAIKDENNPFINQQVGQPVNLVGHIVYVQGQYKIWVINSDLVEISPFNQTSFKAYLLDSLQLEESFSAHENIQLLLKDPQFGLDVDWTSSNQAILSASGVVNAQEEDILVTLTYVASNTSRIVYTGTIQVTVTKAQALSLYYKDAEGKMGEDLLIELTRIISRNYKGISYSATNRILEVSDRHPSGQGYLGIYDHISITSYNKEHVWPQSSFNEASPYKSDMHHLRISDSKTNSIRSNYYFNLPVSPTTRWQVGSSRFFPGDLDKGDIARMLMYMAVRYRNDNFKLIIAESGRTSNAPSRTMGNLAVLYQWHLDDPVDDFEKNRNQVIFETQNNRNPFIDHPELFESIWNVFMSQNQKRSRSAERLNASDFTYGEITDSIVLYFVSIEESKKRYMA